MMTAKETELLAIFNSHQQLKAVRFELTGGVRWRVHYSDRPAVNDYCTTNSILTAALGRAL